MQRFLVWNAGGSVTDLEEALRVLGVMVPTKEQETEDSLRLRNEVGDLTAAVARRDRQNATLMKVIKGAADSRDRLAAEVTEGVQAIERLTAELDECKAKLSLRETALCEMEQAHDYYKDLWEAIPWTSLGLALCYASQIDVRQWFKAANRGRGGDVDWGQSWITNNSPTCDG